MQTAENPTAPYEAVVARLTEDDDLSFWHTVLTVLTDEFLHRYEEAAKNREWLFIVGACSHWVRPHNSSWKTGAGRFVSPDGYKDWSPELDWSAIFVYRNRHWTRVEKPPGKRCVMFRAAVPTRTARHKQAAVNARWLPAGETVLYGFLHVEGRWKCVAASDDELHGRIGPTSRS